MAALNINTYYGCTTCAHADIHGNGCAQSLMLPVALIMNGATRCPKYKFKDK